MSGSVTVKFTSSEVFTTDTVEFNFKRLEKYQKGQRLYTDSYGTLCVLKEGLFAKIWYLWNQRKIEKNVKEAISAVVTHICDQKNIQYKIAGLNVTKSLVSDPEKIKKDEEQAKGKFYTQFFVDKISSLSLAVFDRGIIAPEVENFMVPDLATRKIEIIRAKRLIEISKSGIETLEKNKINVSQAYLKESQYILGEDRQRLREAEYAYKIEAVRFALKLGVPFKKLNSGAGGSYLGRMRDGTNALVFKPEGEGPDGSSPHRSRRIWTLLVGTFSSKTRPGFEDHNDSQAEVCASIIDKHIQMRRVPITKIETFKDGKFYGPNDTGSCQFFETGVDSDKFSGMLRDKEVKKLAIIDFLVGNIDRHSKNLLVNSKGKLLVIDNGWSMNSSPVDGNNLAERHQHLFWRSLPQSQKHFTKEDEIYLDNLERNKEAMFKELEKAMPSFNSFGARTMLESRIEVLRLFIKQRKTIHELSNVRTSADFKRVLNS